MVMVVASLMVNRELVMECKSIEGDKVHDNGYIKFSTTTMVMGVTFDEGPNATCVLG